MYIAGCEIITIESSGFCAATASVVSRHEITYKIIIICISIFRRVNCCELYGFGSRLPLRRSNIAVIFHIKMVGQHYIGSNTGNGQTCRHLRSNTVILIPLYYNESDDIVLFPLTVPRKKI